VKTKWRAGKSMAEYLARMKGSGRAPRTKWSKTGLMDSFWAWVGSAVGVGVCAYLSSRFFEPRDVTLLLGSFGASAVLVYGAIKSPLAQPRNLVGGHLISSLIGVACYQMMDATWVAAALAVSLAIVAMVLTDTVHPPGGATALIAVIGGEQVHNLGFLYTLLPTGLGVLILLIIALIVNNLSRNRRFPDYWF
jgi:CBS-domain-containing membrane protein